MASCTADLRAIVATAIAALGAAAAQTPIELRAAIADRSTRARVPAIDWLCGTALPTRPEWPNGLDADGAFAIVWTPHGIEVSATRVTLPDGVVAAGSCSIAGGPPMVWSCGVDGVEDWFVPRDFTAPPEIRNALAAFDADVLDEPRMLDASVLIGHAAGVAVDGDPRAELLRVGGALCGQVAWKAWRTPSHLRVRGRSDGGLVLPAVLFAIARDGAPSTTSALSLRAFAARDGDRAEAARQSSRRETPQSLATLRALLRADDATALAAIDALVRLRATDELPRIVAAARPDAPWASLAAADALRELWIDASPSVRANTKRAQADCRAIEVRSIDLDRLPVRVPASATDPQPEVDDGSSRGRALLLLAAFAIGLHGLWLRERARLRMAGL
ncbi:MAG: hypothetical protein JNK78_14220 [Planctomycetes bacterium]|nr:hypothetical protein [Planctomycetota bacterium]